MNYSITDSPNIAVIGAGLAGLAAAWQLATLGYGVRVLAKGWGTTHWHAGCIDVLGYSPADEKQPVGSPAAAVSDLIATRSSHPYSLVGLDGLQKALDAFQALCVEAGYPMVGFLERNWLLPSAVGALRPTCLAPETMTAGDMSRDEPALIVGFEQLPDFYPGLAAANLSQQGIPARDTVLDLPALRRRNFTNGVILARQFEEESFQGQVVEALRPLLGEAGRVGFPAVLGLKGATEVWRSLESALGRPVFEIPGLPPSVPGMRLHAILVRAIERAGGRVYDGLEVVEAECADGTVITVQSEAAARVKRHRFGHYLLATGGILGGGIETDHQGRVREVIFDLPLVAPDSRSGWFQQEFVGQEGHPIFLAGLEVNDQFQPVKGDGRPLYDNLFAAGTTLAGGDYIRERSFEGVALSTGYAAGRSVIG